MGAPRPPLTLAYHSVARVPATADPYNLAMPPRLLARHIARLKGWGYQLVTFGDLATAIAEGRGEGIAALTFDDGFEDNLTVALPVLQAAGVPATVFVISGLLGQTHPDAPWARIATAAQVRTLADAGIEIGVHTCEHTALTGLASPDITADVRASREVLQELSGQPVDTLAYPFGDNDERVAAAVAEAGIRAACTTGGGADTSDLLRLPRQDMIRGATVAGLHLKRYDRYEAVFRAKPLRGIRKVVHRITAP